MVRLGLRRRGAPRIRAPILCEAERAGRWTPPANVRVHTWVIEAEPTLLERERELTRLLDAVTGAQRGHGRIVLVEAPAGMGKTSLLKVGGEAAGATGFTCLGARASELERDFAYGCVRQLLEPVVAKAVGAERERLFAGAAALSRPLFGPTVALQPWSLADNSFAMLHGLYWLLANLADECPVALSVDDLHWADPESLRFLNYLSPRLDGLALVVLGSTRSREAVMDLARLAAGPETTVLRPQPLSLGATATLCERRLGGSRIEPAFAAACRDTTGGNPFLLEALLREADEQGISTDARGAARVRRLGPTAVAQVVLLRLSSGPMEAVALVRAAAVLGDGARLSEAAALAELGDDIAARAADRLVALALLETADRLQFAHPIVREAVYADIGPHERAQAHARAADILAASGATEERIAAQIAQAEPIGHPGRVELLRRVAADALARGAPAAALASLSRALNEPPSPASRAEVLMELGAVEYRLARPEAVDHLTSAMGLIRDPRLLGATARWLALALTLAGDADRAVQVIESAVGVIEPDDRELALLLEAELFAHAQMASVERRAPAATRVERYAELAGATSGERLVLASLAFERARASESASEAAGHLEQALAGRRLLGNQDLDVAGPSARDALQQGVVYLVLIGLLATDALDVAEACLEQALADARLRASIPAQAFVIEFRGRTCLRRGDVVRADADARTALELLTAHDIHLGTAYALGLLIEALLEQGEVEAAETALRASGLGDDIPPDLAINALLEARGLLRLAQGRSHEGLDDLLEFGRRDEMWGSANPLASRWRSHACMALAAQGDRDAALRMARDDLERARRWGAASGIGIALRATGLLERGTAAVGHLHEAAEVLERSPARLEQARALTDLGAALRRGNHRAEARRKLEQGLDLACRCGAHALVQRARIELQAAGGRSSEPERRGVEDLTASERRVAELAAEGRSNPEIAQALFVTRKTVETHLGHVYRKLRISGRTELGGVLR
jgi:DNA-binding CsgD family transcriptional regulator/tetratricopeptide (TPR) repeat protein